MRSLMPKVLLPFFVAQSLASIPSKAFLLLKKEPPPIAVAIVGGTQTVSHVGIGFLSGFVYSGVPQYTYEGLGPLLIQSTRANASFGYALNGESKFQDFKTFEYVQRQNSQGLIQVVLSDHWPDNYGWPYSPQGNIPDWEDLVKKLVTTTVDKFGINNVQIDIFNEPDKGSSEFLNTRPVSALPYYDSWKKTVRYIRTLDLAYRNVKIVGPSISGYNDFVLYFLEAANADRVLPDVVSWHEIDAGSKSDLDLNINAVRNFMQSRNIPVRDFSINEYLDKEETYNPGISIAFFSKLEKAKVVSAMKACWDSTDCEGGNFNGLYVRNGNLFSPSSIWWAYKWYSDMTGFLIQEPRLLQSQGFIGSIDNVKNQIQMCFSNASISDLIGPRVLSIEKIPSFFIGPCKITLEVIRNSVTQSYGNPEMILIQNISLNSSSVLVNQPRLAAGDIFRFTLIKQ